MSPTRRLAAILAADVAGYSRLMGADEEGTHERLKAHLRELVDPKIEEHRGRIVKNTGDGWLAEFPSVVDAVRCAVEVQRGMIEREPDMPEERRIRFRIGVNLGDVIVEPEDIFGDGVNIAARVEALAEPGGIFISGTVRDHIGDRLPYAFADMGEQQVKNIARPVRLYAWRPEDTASVSTTSASSATSISQFPLAPRLSIVVLPFTNLSNDPEQQYFADAITEDLTMDLSRLAGMFVISRNTAFTYLNKPIDTKQIGRELGVRYVLEGSVRRLGNQVRVNAQLIDAATDAHLWAERFSAETSDLFSLQDEITTRIAVTLSLELVKAEVARPSQHPDAQDYILHGRAVGMKPQSRETSAEVIALYEQALALDPQSVETQGRLAIALMGRVLNNMTDTPAADLARAEALAQQATAASPHNDLVHQARGLVFRAQRRYAEAIPEYEAMLAANRNAVFALVFLGQCKTFTGALEQTIPLVEQAIRLSPRDPLVGHFYLEIGRVHLLRSHTDEAIAWLEKSRGAMPEHSAFHAYLAAAYGLIGEIDRAAAELAVARRLALDDRFSSLSRLQAIGYWGVPKIRALFEATYFAGLRLAGMPEE